MTRIAHATDAPNAASRSRSTASLRARRAIAAIQRIRLHRAALAAVGAIALVALPLRVWNMDAIFETSDQAAMPYMILSRFGIEWIFAHPYGPVLPALYRAYAAVLNLLAIPFSETAARVPVMLISLVQTSITWPLMRRLGNAPQIAALGVLFAAVLPCLVVDAHYPWADHATWLLLGSISLWATLAWQQDRQRRQLAVAAIALFLHCLSSLYAFALPLTLMFAWGRFCVRARKEGVRLTLCEAPEGPFRQSQPDPLFRPVVSGRRTTSQ
jgi:hypothetical protein